MTFFFVYFYKSASEARKLWIFAPKMNITNLLFLARKFKYSKNEFHKQKYFLINELKFYQYIFGAKIQVFHDFTYWKFLARKFKYLQNAHQGFWPNYLS